MATHRRQPSVTLAPRPHRHTNQAGSSSHFIFVTGPDWDFLPVQLHYRQILYAAPPGPHHCQCPKVSPNPSLPAPTARGRLSDYFLLPQSNSKIFLNHIWHQGRGPCFDTFWRPPLNSGLKYVRRLAFEVRAARAPPPRWI